MAPHPTTDADTDDEYGAVPTGDGEPATEPGGEDEQPPDGQDDD